jgi:exodeoxyribonuclease VII large subunit
VKPDHLEYGDRRVYTVSAFNQGVASWIARLPTLWIEGEVTELRRQQAWQGVYFTLKDPEDGATVAVTMPRSGFDALRLELADGARVHVYGRPELWAARGVYQVRALSIEPVGLGAVLLRLEQLRRKLAAEGLFAPERKRRLPSIPSRIGLVTGPEAAAKQDVIAAIRQRFPPARILIAETYVQGPRAAGAIVEALQAVCRAGVDVVVLARGGGSFDDLLPFSDERLVRAVAACPVPVVSAVGHEQDRPLCDLAADLRASTPTGAARLVVPDQRELQAELVQLRAAIARAARRRMEWTRRELERDRVRLVRAPALLLERKRALLADRHTRLRSSRDLLLDRRRERLDGLAGRLRAIAPGATLKRGYAIVRADGRILRSATGVAVDNRIDVELASGSLGARVEDVRDEIIER